MSSQKGNVSRSRQQKYQNARAFKNDMHDTSNTIKMINSLTLDGLCKPCKEKIEWKIKYKKYKPLSQPATCVKCHKKCVKRAYLVVCQSCAQEADVCAKCNQKKKIVVPPQPSASEAMAEEEMNRLELMQLPERKRRAVLRNIEKGGSVASGSMPKVKSADGDDDVDDFDGGEEDENLSEGDPEDGCDADPNDSS